MHPLEALLSRHWWRPGRSVLAQALRPLSWLYRALFWLDRTRAGAGQRAPVPTVVVGNLVVGGVGKTPLVIELVQALQAAGFQPGVLSRGFGRRETGAMAVTPHSAPQTVGDEPLLIARRTGAPTWVGRSRLQAARALCAAHPQVDVLVCDDGLQHHALVADAELWVFDARGVGNGLLLPAGPLRQPLPKAPGPKAWVVYTAASASTALPGLCVPRQMRQAVPLAAWREGSSAGAVALATLQGRPLTALAGIATPEAFFSALQAHGLTLTRLPMPDHAAYATPPWPPGSREVITTEKDAVKLSAELMALAAAPRGVAAPQVWVVPLDSPLPPALMHALLERLRAVRRVATGPPTNP